MSDKKTSSKAVATIKSYIKAAQETQSLPKSYVEYKPYIPTKKTENLKTYGNGRERIIN